MKPAAARAKRCPVLGCTERIKNNYLMCPDCWRTAPRWMKKELSASRGTLAVGTVAWKLIEYVGAWKSPLLPAVK